MASRFIIVRYMDSPAVDAVGKVYICDATTVATGGLAADAGVEIEEECVLMVSETGESR